MTHSPDAYHLTSFVDWLRSWGASQATIDARIVVARQASGHWPDPALVTPHDIVEFLSSEAFAPWTRTTYYGHLRSLFAWLTERGSIESDPMLKVRRPKPPKNRPRPLTPEDQEKVLSDATGHLRAWLLLGLYAGFRAHEAAKIQGRDVTQTTIYVRGKGGKDAMVPTHPVVWEVAQRYGEGYWFPTGRGHIASTNLSSKVTAHFRKHGVEGSYHRCRHAYGTSLLRAGVNLRIVQTLMRHEALTSTAAYLAVDEDERAAAVRLLVS